MAIDQAAALLGSDPRIDADDCLARLAACHRPLACVEGGAAIELYHRASVSTRATMERGEKPRVERHGTEEGTALRARAAAAPRLRFASSSGAGPRTIARLLEIAEVRLGTGGPSDVGWHPVEVDVLDRDEGATEPPDGAALVAWLERAVERLAESRGVRCRRAWIEVASTVESWVWSGGGRASRARRRAWALAEPDLPGRRGRPVVLACRRSSDLPVDGWGEAIAPPECGRHFTATVPEGTPVVLAPHPAALLVQALVAAVHGDVEAVGRAVGGGWVVSDRPDRPGALFGGRFDDGGHPTAPTALADGRTVVGSIGSRGHLRRASFRDRPRPIASCLEVGSSPAPLPADRLAVDDLRIHAVGPGAWVLEVGGRLWSEGEPGPPIETAWARLRPTDLLARCSATAGPALASHRGVTTPSLVFDPWW